MKRLPFSFMPNAPLAAMLVSLTALSGCGGSDGSSDGGSIPPAGPDTTAPVITIKGANPLAHAYGETYIELGATAVDAVDGVVAISIEGDINVDVMGNYIITYTATDKAGNKATSNRKVTVADLTAPLITLNGESVVNLAQWVDEYSELGATAIDNIDGDLIVTPPSGSVDATVAGTYTLTYAISDAAGNEASLVRTVNVVEQKPFIITWLIETPGQTIKLPLNPEFIAEGYNYRVDWGDDSFDSNQTTALPHTYATTGRKTITINGVFPALYSCQYGERIVEIQQWGDIEWLSMEGAVGLCTDIVIPATEVPDLSQVKTMDAMFTGTNFNADISHWDVSDIEDMDGMFFQAPLFNQDLSRWDVSSVKKMSNMFSNATAFNHDLSAWDISSVISMSSMFSSVMLSPGYYDNMLNSWSRQGVRNVPFGVGDNIRTDASIDAYNDLIDKGWRITDGNP